MSLAALAGLFAATLASGYIMFRIRQALRAIETAVASGDRTAPIPGGMREFEETIQRLDEYAQRWAEAATTGRRQIREVESLLSVNIDAVSHHAGSAQQSVAVVRESASDASLLVQQLAGGVDRIRQHLETSETKLRALVDHAQEIGAIVDAIGSISARTDLLALNASIESVRAGETARSLGKSVGQLDEALQPLRRSQSAKAGLEEVADRTAAATAGIDELETAVDQLITA